MAKKLLTEAEILTKFIASALVGISGARHHSVGVSLQQAHVYTEIPDVLFAYGCNGNAFLDFGRSLDPAGGTCRASP